MTILPRFLLAAAVLLAGSSCVEAPPVIPALGSQSLTLRLFVFGADAEDAHDAFQAVNKNNPSFTVVPTGGDAELLVGLEKDSAQCVEPTALCSYKVTYRVRTPKGEVLDMAEQSIMANSDSCSSLCDAALNKVAVEVVGAVAQLVKGGKPATSPAEAEPTPPPEPEPAASAAPSTSAPPKPGAPPTAPHKPGAAPSASAAPPPPPPPPAKPAGKPTGKVSLCSLGEGPRLPAKEAETRVAQVDALKRLNIIDQAEFDCLRTAYLNRL